jgi:hypothetical protein
MRFYTLFLCLHLTSKPVKFLYPERFSVPNDSDNLPVNSGVNSIAISTVKCNFVLQNRTR